MVRSNNGAPGTDKITLAAVEEYGVTRLLDELASELRAGRYRPLPARRVLIPKPGSAENRPLSIPPVRDRIVQAALKIVLEPVFEADFLPCSFGFRPRLSAHDALQVPVEECARGRRWVGGGWWRRTSPPASRRSRMRASWRPWRNASATSRS
jgi:RNA-directed DNA polymerase